MAAGPVGPTGLRERALGPDLARGFMLLFIAVANSHYFLQGSSFLGGFPQDGSLVDRGIALLIATFVDGRAFPMFGLLFGYGVQQIVRRQQESGRTWRSTRWLLWRRSLLLVVLGLLHGVLLYVGDILAAYGVLLFIGAWLLRRGTVVLIVVAALAFVLTALPSADSLATATNGPDAAMLPGDFGAQVVEHLKVQPFIALLGWIGFVVPFVLGVLAGRHRILERPAEYLVLLRWIAVIGLAIGVAGGLPVALAIAGVVDRPSAPVLEILGPLHDATGVPAGCGYAALIVLVAHHLTTRSTSTGGPGPIALAIAATGQRSLTCYLAQSIVWWVVFTPYVLDLSTTLTITTTAFLATATWLSTVLLANHLHHHGHRGPFESIMRRFTYR